MTRILFLAGVNCLLLAGAAISIAATPVAAQANAETQAASEQVTVTAPYIIRRKVVTPPLSQNRFPVEVVSVDYPVSYADLDLSRTADTATFEKRIGDAAKEACAQLTKKYPPDAFMPTPGNQDCVGTATRQAMSVAKQVIGLGVQPGGEVEGVGQPAVAADAEGQIPQAVVARQERVAAAVGEGAEVRPAHRVEGVDLGVEVAEVADQQGRRRTGRSWTGPG